MNHKLNSVLSLVILSLMVMFTSCQDDDNQPTPTPVVDCSNFEATIASPTIDSTIQVDATGGVEPYTYSWSTGETSQQITPSGSDSVLIVTVTDAAGCTLDSYFNYIGNPSTNPCSSFSIEIMYSIDSTATTNDNYALYSNNTGGTSPFSYEWSNGSTTDVINVAPGTSHSLTVTDSQGCTAEDQIQL